jgi:hypothetical protein
MDPEEHSPETSKKSVSRNPLSNLQTLLKDRIPQISLSNVAVGRGLLGASILLNLLLLWAVISIGNHLFKFRSAVGDSMLDAVSQSVGISADSQIETTVTIQEEIPVSFEVPLEGDTLVTLSQPVQIDNATLSIRSATLAIDAPAVITLPVGAELPITMDLTVPVSVTVPVDLTVPVRIGRVRRSTSSTGGPLRTDRHRNPRMLANAPLGWGLPLILPAIDALPENSVESNLVRPSE